MTTETLILILLALATLGYVIGIIYAGVYTLRGTPGIMPAFLVQVINVIGGVLAINCGAVLGLSVASGTQLSLGATPTETLQIFGAFVYIGGLILATLFWGLRRFDSDTSKVVGVLPQLAQTLAGVVAGALAVALGVSQA